MAVIGLGEIAAILEQAVEEGADLRPQILDDAQHLRRARPLIDQEVELLVAPQIAGGIVGRDVDVDLLDDPRQAGDVRAAEIRRRQLAGALANRPTRECSLPPRAGVSMAKPDAVARDE